MGKRRFNIADFLKPGQTSFPSNTLCAGDSFLLDEGLDLLAAYKAIPDTQTRLALKRLVEQIAAMSGRGEREV